MEMISPPNAWLLRSISCKRTKSFKKATCFIIYRNALANETCYPTLHSLRNALDIYIIACWLKIDVTIKIILFAITLGRRHSAQRLQDLRFMNLSSVGMPNLHKGLHARSLVKSCFSSFDCWDEIQITKAMRCKIIYE